MSDLITVPDGYRSRAATVDDAPAIATMLAAAELHDLGKAEMTTDDLIDDLHGTDFAEETVLILAPDGSVGAYADVLNRSYISVSIYGYVHPDHRSRGLGTALMQWGEGWISDRIERAPEGEEVTIQQFILASNQPARDLMTSRGFDPIRSTYTMTINMEEPPPEPVWPAGFQVRPFQLGRDDREAFETADDAFQDTWGHVPAVFEEFLTQTTRKTFDPDLWVLAESEGTLQGVSLTRKVEAGAWVDTVGVRRSARGQGLGLALMRETFRRCYERGIREVGLSVDAESHTGAPRLYLRAGMRQKDHYILHKKVLRPAT